jgi:small-conductance mechanosensitive channel
MNELMTFLLDTPILNTGEQGITIKPLLLTVLMIVIVVFVLRTFRRVVMKRIAKRPDANLGPINSVMMLTSYVIIIVTGVTAIQWSGLHLGALAVIFGALSVGIGFGLQNIVNNFVSGIVILIERPIKLGDRIVVDDIEGNIVDIAIRASTLRTNEGVSVIVPNSYFIGSTVVNRSLDYETVRMKVYVNVAFDSDPRLVETVLLAVAHSIDGIHKEPPPIVIFESFGESALRFYLWVWTSEFAHMPDSLQSAVNFGIRPAFAEAGIRVPYPQLDIHVKQPGSILH